MVLLVLLVVLVVGVGQNWPRNGVLLVRMFLYKKSIGVGTSNQSRPQKRFGIKSSDENR